MASADELIARLRAGVADALAAAIPPGPVSLVDYPAHSNVGDSAIWLGEMAWLDDVGRTPVYSASMADFSDEDLERAAPTGPILVHGGGNFGTTWPRHEAFRRELLARFPDRPVIQLPQSIHYSDDRSAAETAGAIRRHGGFTVLARDERSRDFAQRHFSCDVRLAPDSALYLGRLARGPASVDVLALLRTDHERAIEAPPATGAVVTDWLEEDVSERRSLRVRLRLRSLFDTCAQARRLRSYRALAAWRVGRGVATLSRGRAIVTDRLHAHILSLLLDLPHVVLDNSYGKIADFAAQWTGDYVHLHRAADPAQAFERARRLVRGG